MASDKVKEGQVQESIAATNQLNPNDDSDLCAICHVSLRNNDADEELLETPCEHPHVFHKNCLIGWLTMGLPGDNCPVCRTKLSLEKRGTEYVVVEVGRTSNELQGNLIRVIEIDVSDLNLDWGFDSDDSDSDSTYEEEPSVTPLVTPQE